MATLGVCHDGRHQCLSAIEVFRTQLVSANKGKKGFVTNACRQLRSSGRDSSGWTSPTTSRGHQCLSAIEVFRTGRIRMRPAGRLRVTNACRQLRSSGRKPMNEDQIKELCHQCLSAIEVFRTRQASAAANPAKVTNACWQLRSSGLREIAGDPVTYRVTSPMPVGN